jgi:F-type H+-transporting ATPase subunit gamma
MASLKEIRIRLASVASTRQITNAMKMVSAAKLKKAQDAIVQIRPYANKLHELLQRVSDSLSDDEDNLYALEREIHRVLVVVIASNRGLCGAFNASVVRQVLHIVHEDYGKQLARNDVDFMVIGKKGAEPLKKLNYKIISQRNDLFDRLSFDNIIPVAEEIMKGYVNKSYDKVILVYNQFKNAAVQILTTEQFLPVMVPVEEENKQGGALSDYIYEPSKDFIVKELIPRSLKIQFYKALLDSNASEHGARMTSMHKATDNATEIIKELKLHYNKARQASITNEILEIVSGAEALKG